MPLYIGSLKLVGTNHTPPVSGSWVRYYLESKPYLLDYGVLLFGGVLL